MTPLLKAMPLLAAVLSMAVGTFVWVVESSFPILFFVLAGTVYFSLFIWAGPRRLMDEVWMDETSLLVRNGGREERVDLLGVLKIRDHFKWGYPRLTLTLKQPCGFGPTISFCVQGWMGNHVLLRRNYVARQLADRIETLRNQASP